MNSMSQVPRICYKKILYTTDLSEEGREAFPHAAGLARLYEAELTILHIVESQEFEKFLVGYINDEIWDEIKNRNLQEARNILIQRKRKDTAIRDDIQALHRDAATDTGQDVYVTYDIVVKTGDAVEQILAQVDRGGYDLVIMAKQGHGTLRDGPMGETARRVIRHCKVPVMVVPVDGTQTPC
jgi:nucleotide-binding universal stress UspA family protein